MHEASLHEDSAFLTLTYRPEAMPEHGTLVKSHFQDFMKRLRARLQGRALRYFHCGEYGELLGRPHYHCILYGYGFPDRLYYRSANGVKLYTSAFLDDVWSHGFCVIGDVTFESAAYVARYVTKKITGAMADGHYLVFDRETGECAMRDGGVVRREPEYVTMSRRPGIGSRWFESFGSEVFPADEVIVRGHECKPPRYYEKLFEAAHGDIESVKDARAKRARGRKHDNTDERLAEREYCAERRLGLLKRGYESEV